MPLLILEILNEFEQLFLPLLSGGWEILRAWWWILVPLVLHGPFLYFWLWWRREKFWAGIKFVVLEIKIPKDILKPLKAMEQAFSSIWGNIYDPPDWWEVWIDGKELKSFTLELVSKGGEPHFFIRVPEKNRDAVEASLYAQYPDAEISVADDYTRYVPQDIPNKDWEMWGTDYYLIKDDVYPIKTYSKFFEEKPEVAKEEKRLDPLATLLEGMAKLKPGEQLWIQIAAMPVTSLDNDFISRGEDVVRKFTKRPKEEKPKAMIWQAAEEAVGGLVTGELPEVKEEKEEVIPPEMRLTPGEREIVASVEGKVGQYCFECFARFIYLARKEAYFAGAKSIPFGFFSQFDTTNLNAIIPWTRTITKIKKHWFLPLNLILPRRLFVRKRHLFRHYIERIPPLFPWLGGTFILDTEELATIFHLPGRGVAPAPFVPRVEAKKGEAPSGLPTE